MDRSAQMQRLVKRISVAATVGMFLVLVMGAAVTNTGSAEGCGRSWPLCNGQLIPELAVATLIELSHRAVTGIEGFLVVAATVGAWAFWRQHREIKVLAPLMLGSLLLQAGMGAWAVLYPQTTAVLALHFGISLIAFASVFLTTAFLYEVDGSDALRDRPVSAGSRWAIWGAAVYLHVVVYLGAYIRHAKVDLACQGWPLCNGAVFPGFSGGMGIVFTHRLAALAAVLVLGGLAAWARRRRAERPDLWRGSVATFVLVLLQALSGAVVVFTNLSLFSALAHAGIMALLFAAMGYVCLHALPRAAEAPRTVGVRPLATGARTA